MTDNITEENPPVNTFEDLLTSIKTEDGRQKFNTVEDALKSIEHKDTHIKTLETEKAEERAEIERLKLELEKRKSVEEVVEGLAGRQQQAPEDPKETPKEPQGLSQEDISKMVQDQIDARDSASRQQANIQAFMDNLKSRFGDKTSEAVKEVVNSTKMTSEDFSKLVAENPALVSRLFDSVKVESNAAPTKPGLTTPVRQEERGLEPPTKKLITGGAKSEDLKHEWGLIRQDVYNKHNVET